MAGVIMADAVSLDGFLATEDDQVGPLHDFYFNGDTRITAGNRHMSFKAPAASARYLDEQWSRIGAMVIGRRLFDLTDGWDGVPVAGDRVFVVTHSVPTDWKYMGTAPFTFVTDGVASAIAQAKAVAGPDRDVAVNGGDVGGQAFAAGLVDEVDVALVPVVFGSGKRFFGDRFEGQVLLEDPVVVPSERVTHLRYRVRKS
ncbi:dihydrofolate reductase family protein [Catenulispora sp. NF23]|uniref:Dihydrofolate reductase family protein n=1 Tax=Catenulispora pinistramenti TaxID=2705254 RepID=A0ABS5KJ41_9ACTN|nr:dihydrofolate reductase family protein [Catenulispora pinistramenti]MBS2532343.1 dihydrofolate reductase family protein [Catenulispora pinistramenti]MBS2546112.1 dihydrofolate reductase family protein [Catenulispora pinistramenti]